MKTFLALSTLSMALAAFAQENTKIDIDFSADLHSRYVWRGINLCNNWVLQPQVTLAKSGFSASIWGNVELTNPNQPLYGNRPAGKFTEWDSTLRYTHVFGNWSGWVGYTDYQFPSTGAARYQEWNLGANLAHEWNPELNFWFGTSANMGMTANLGVSKSFNTLIGAKSMSLDFDAAIGFADKKGAGFYYGTARSGFTDFCAGLSTAVECGQWTLTPGVHYSTLLHNSLLAGAPNRTNAWVSLSFSRKF